MESISKLFQKSTSLLMLAAQVSIFFSVISISAIAQPVSPASDLQLGVKLLNEKKFNEAIDLLKKATAANKRDADGWYYLGFAYIHAKDFKNAIKSLEAAIKLRRQFAEAHAALAYALLLRDKLKESRVEAARSLSLQTVNPVAHYTLGVVEFRTGAKNKALEHANQAIHQSPGFAEAYLLKVEALVTFHDWDSEISESEKRLILARYREAAVALAKYLELTPDSESKQMWRDQAEALNFSIRTKENKEVFQPAQVTTKARLISKPEPQYTLEARRAQVTGTVVLRAVFGSDGVVKHILILKALRGGLTERAVQAARGIKFVPATLDGKPVSMWLQLEYNFSLY